MAIESRLMTLDGARDIAHDVARIYSLMGAQASYPYHQFQLVRAMLTILDNAKFDGVDKEEVTKWKRKFNSLHARYAKFAKQHGHDINEELAELDSDA